MGRLPGIEKLDFDCKTATITMKEGATISREKATELIVKAGFGVTKFEGGPPPKVTAYAFRVTGIAPGKYAVARQALQGALDSPRLVSVDETGAAAVTLAAGQTTTEAALAEALKKAGLGLEGFAVAEWPEAPAVYEIEFGASADAGAAMKVRGALVALAKVFSAESYPEKGRAVVRLNEPCDAIEGHVRSALAAAGFEVKSFRLATR